MKSDMRLIAVLVAIVFLAPNAPSGQGLASVAKKEEARRKSVKAPAKVYTNENLKPDITASAVPSPTNASPGDPTPSAQVPSVNLPGGTAAEVGREAKDEAYWRSRITQARSVSSVSASLRTRFKAD